MENAKNLEEGKKKRMKSGKKSGKKQGKKKGIKAGLKKEKAEKIPEVRMQEIKKPAK